LKNTYPQYSYKVQYEESDLAFVQRLLAEEGLSTKKYVSPIFLQSSV
ncbi:contractile injection system protein, VgrG/Pvc8 family, partial [Vibrio parahaemolyticus]